MLRQPRAAAARNGAQPTASTSQPELVGRQRRGKSQRQAERQLQPAELQQSEHQRSELPEEEQQQQQQQQPAWATAAPRTAAASSGPDPQLLELAQRLLAARGPGAVRAALAEHPLDGAGLRRLLTCLERAGAPGLGLAAARAAGDAWKRGPDAPLLWTKLIRMHGRRPADAGAALAIYRQMLAEGGRPDRVTYNIALAAAARGRVWKAALGVLADMDGAAVGRDAFTYSALLSAAQACGKWEQAVAWVDEMRAAGPEPNRAGRWDHSLRVFREMEEAGVEPDVVAHNAAITAHARGDDWEKAWAAFAVMRQAGLQPSTVSYNALLNACERCGQPDRALEVFGRMERDPGVRPNAVTYNTLISSLGKAGRCQHALELYARMQHEGVPDDVWTLTALITAAERAGGGTAGGASKELRGGGAAAASGAGGGWQAALDWFRRFQRRGIQPNAVAYNRLISVLGAGGQWQLALAAFEAMRASTARASSASSASSSGSGLGGRRRPPGGAVAGGGQGPGGAFGAAAGEGAAVRPDVITYGSLIAVLERAGQWQRALQLSHEMQEEGIQPNAYIISSLINACERGGRFSEAVQLFKRWQELEGPQPSGSASATVIARKVLYAFPQLVELMPAPLVSAARMTVSLGRAARQRIGGGGGSVAQRARPEQSGDEL
eukprot:scaffold1.g5379.t1